jgi:preprotein translocase subunit SecG
MGKYKYFYEINDSEVYDEYAYTKNMMKKACIITIILTILLLIFLSILLARKTSSSKKIKEENIPTTLGYENYAFLKLNTTKNINEKIVEIIDKKNQEDKTLVAMTTMPYKDPSLQATLEKEKERFNAFYRVEKQEKDGKNYENIYFVVKIKEIYYTYYFRFEEGNYILF